MQVNCQSWCIGLVGFSHGTKPLFWSLLALLGGKVLRHCDCSKRSPANAEYLEVYPCQSQSSRGKERFVWPLLQLWALRQVGVWWHQRVVPQLPALASSLKGCSRRYERFCERYRYHAKAGAKCHWGSRMLKRFVQSSRSNRSKRNRISPGQQQLPFAFDVRLNQIPEEWHQVVVTFRRANGIRDGDLRLLL